MSVWKRNSLIVLAIVTVLALVFHDAINRFLFHPEGLSTAASELCVINQAGLPLVVQISIDGGANSLTLIDDAGEACSPAPSDDLQAEIRFSIKERTEPFCTLQTVSGEVETLLVFDAPDKCEWAE